MRCATTTSAAPHPPPTEHTSRTTATTFSGPAGGGQRIQRRDPVQGEHPDTTALFGADGVGVRSGCGDHRHAHSWVGIEKSARIWESLGQRVVAVLLRV
jgi:hypothetical protein